MEIPVALIGCEVWRVAFDYQVRLTLCALGEGTGYRVHAELEIETEFRFRDANGDRHELEPGTGVLLAPALELFQKRVATVEIRGPGSLHLGFDDGTELVVDPHPEFESWHLFGDGVGGITVGPGGETGWRHPG